MISNNMKKENIEPIKAETGLFRSKNFVIIISVLLVLTVIGIFLTGGDDDTPTGSAVKEKEKEIVCNAPYIRHGDDCCLDENTNGVCDDDEEIPVTVAVADACSDTTYFECLSSYITNDNVFFRLKAKREGYVHLKKIGLPGFNCYMTFTEKDILQGTKIRGVTDVVVPCKIDKEILENIPYDLQLMFYPQDDIDDGSYLTKNRGVILSESTMSGTVRSEAPTVI